MIILAGEQVADFGVNTVWVPGGVTSKPSINPLYLPNLTQLLLGGMSQFETLTISERKSLLEAWVHANRQQNLGLYIIAHVGTDVAANARELADHAAYVGADAIAAVPPCYEHPGNVSIIITWLSQISSAAPNLPLFYYHIPAATHAVGDASSLITVHGLLQAASGGLLPALIGVKYVSSDMQDWFKSVRDFNDSHALLFAPEPKLQSFAIGLGRGLSYSRPAKPTLSN